MATISPEEIKCPFLLNAYGAALTAIDEQLPGSDLTGIKYDDDTFGNSVTTKNRSVRKSVCAGCDRNVTVTEKYPKINATDRNTGKKVKLYDSFHATRSIVVTGPKCSIKVDQR